MSLVPSVRSRPTLEKIIYTVILSTLLTVFTYNKTNMVNWLDYKSKMFSYNFAVDEANKKYQKDYNKWFYSRPTEQKYTEQEVEDNPLKGLINEFYEPTYSEHGKPVNPLLKYLPVPTKPNLEHLKPVKPEPQKFFSIIIIVISLIILFLFGGKRTSHIKITNENSLD